MCRVAKKVTADPESCCFVSRKSGSARQKCDRVGRGRTNNPTHRRRTSPPPRNMRRFDIPPEGLPPVDASAAAGWDPTQKIVVVGGGAAGLSAAYTLRYLGVPCVLLEAAGAVGGRCQRDEEMLKDVGAALDTGAEWLHTTRDASVLRELLLFPEDREDAEKFVREEVIEYLPGDMYYSRPCAGGLRKNNALKAAVEVEYKFKTTSWSQYLEKYFVSRVKDEIRTDAVVTKIDYSSPQGGAKVTLKDGTEFSAAKVICAVPVSVLKDGDIAFEPPLPSSKRDALKKTKMKPGLKVAIEFKERFYPAGGWFNDIGLASQVFWLAYDYGSESGFFDALTNKGIDDKHVLSLYASGALAEDLARLPDDEIYQRCLETLDAMFQGRATEHAVRHRVTNWTQVPFIRGAYGSLRHAASMTREFAAPLGDDRVFFAGEFVGGRYVPCVHGACLTGRRAALNAIGKEYVCA